MMEAQNIKTCTYRALQNGQDVYVPEPQTELRSVSRSEDLELR